MENNFVEIKPSSIEGLGVFAKEDLAKNIKICDYYGVEMSWTQFTKQYGKYKLNSLNTYPMRRIWRIICSKEEPFKSQNIVNFINEGEPNCILKMRALYALREIKCGEELLLQYPKDYNRHWKKGET
jgi:SET domain-containing protein